MNQILFDGGEFYCLDRLCSFLQYQKVSVSAAVLVIEYMKEKIAIPCTIST